MAELGGVPTHREAVPLLGWPDLRRLVSGQASLLSAPRAAGNGLCKVCHGPLCGGRSRCYNCDLHLVCGGDALADLVVPVAFAVKGGQHARHLWQYKSARSVAGAEPGVAAGLAAGPVSSPRVPSPVDARAWPAADERAWPAWRPRAWAAANSSAEPEAYPSAEPEANPSAEPKAMLRALLLVFLRDHAGCLWRAAGITGPTLLAVVPTARGRPGVHPLRVLIEPYLTLPWAELSARPGGIQVRDLDPHRFSARPVPGGKVLLIDDTWTTGSSAQSAAMALRRAGASSVVTVVLGRHVGRADAAAAGIGPAVMPFNPQSCAVHNDHVAFR